MDYLNLTLINKKKIEKITENDLLSKMDDILNNTKLVFFDDNIELSKNIDPINFLKLWNDSKNNEIEENFKCQFCEKSFSQYYSLGGHISKVHRFRSKKYKHRISRNKINNISKKRKEFYKSC